MTEIERLKLAIAAEQAIRELRNASDAPERDQAEAVAIFAVRVLAAPNVFSPEKLLELWRVLHGGRAGVVEDDDAIRVRACVAIIKSVAKDLTQSPEHEAIWIWMLRQGLTANDAAFTALSDARLLAALRAHAGGQPETGVMADLMMDAGAMGKSRSSDRNALVQQVNKAIKPKTR